MPSRFSLSNIFKVVIANQSLFLVNELIKSELLISKYLNFILISMIIYTPINSGLFNPSFFDESVLVLGLYFGIIYSLRINGKN